MRTKDAMKNNNKKPKPIKEVTQEWWDNLPMSDRYKFAYDKVLEETPDETKLFITGDGIVDTRPCAQRGDCKSHAEEFTHQVAIFAEEDEIKWN